MDTNRLVAVGLAVFSAAAAVAAHGAKLAFAPPFADGMVLQQGVPVAVWGSAPAGEKVTVSFAGASVDALADGSGAWKARLPPMASSSEPRTLALKGDSGSVTVGDVLVGEVWLVGGQSNAECPFWQEKGVRYRDLKGAMMAQLYQSDKVRFTDKPGVWRRCKGDALVDLKLDATKRSTSFSAVGVYFAVELHRMTGVPVGMIGEYVRGSGIDTWIPREGYVLGGGLDDMLEWRRIPAGKWTKECVRYPIVRYGEQPSLYWETLMSRWAPYTFKGVLWVQGCSNIDDKRYRDKLRALYSGWAKHFENPEMRFYFAEVGFGDGKCFNLQLQQAAYAAENPYAALAPANDVGNARDWHGSDKEMIARRLLLHALRRDYGFKHVRGDAPTVKAARAQGGTAVLEIANARTLYLYNADRSMAADFELAGEDGVWRAAEIVNFTRSAWSMEGFIAAPEIVLKAKGVAAPRRARYLHGQGAKSNVYSDVCLPLLAFETELVH